MPSQTDVYMLIVDPVKYSQGCMPLKCITYNQNETIEFSTASSFISLLYFTHTNISTFRFPWMQGSKGFTDFLEVLLYIEVLYVILLVISSVKEQ